MAAATFRFMQATAKTAMRRVLGIRGGQGETLVPPTAVARGDEGFVQGCIINNPNPNHTEWFKPKDEWDNVGKGSSKYL
jgi:hypothetical protein